MTTSRNLSLTMNNVFNLTCEEHKDNVFNLTCEKHMELCDQSHFFQCQPKDPELQDCWPELTVRELNVSLFP